MFAGFLERLRRSAIDKAVRAGRIDDASSLIYMDRYYFRYVESGRCIDVYVEDCITELLFDPASVDNWHRQLYATSYDVATSVGPFEAIAADDRTRITDAVEAELIRRFLRKGVVRVPSSGPVAPK